MLTWEIYEVMTVAEAEEHCNVGKFSDDEARKAGGVWLVTNAGMVRVFGEKRRKRKQA